MPEGTIQIGYGVAINQGLPIEPYFNYSYSQTIYPQADVNSEGDISTVAWEYNGNSVWGPDAIKIYMGHTTETTFATTSSWLDVADLTLVYDGNIVVPAVSNWVPITLDTPFSYNNIANLVIAVEENSDGCHASNDDFYCTVAEGNVSIMYRNDSVNPDPLAPPIGTLKAYYPNVLLLMDTEEDPPVTQYPAPTNLEIGRASCRERV